MSVWPTQRDNASSSLARVRVPSRQATHTGPSIASMAVGPLPGGADGSWVAGSSRGGAVAVADPSPGGADGSWVAGSSRGGAVVVADPSPGSADDTVVSIMFPP